MIYGIRSVALTLALILGAAPAVAQTKPGVPPKKVAVPLVGAGSVDQIQARREFLFNAMLQKPDDLDAAFEYAALSSKVGDLEAAISTLERMLIFAPGLPRLQLELGVLYYRMSAFETARNYFESAIAAPGVPDEVRAKVESYLSRIDTAQETTRFSGQVRVGIRYQTNANRAPTDSTILLNGIPFTLTDSSLGSEDGNVFGSGVFHWSFDLPSQGNSFEVDLVTYGSKQFERTELDTGFGEVTFGPAFDLGRFGIDNAAIGIYGIASTVFLDEDFYNVGYGAGTRFVIKPQPSTTILAAFEYRHKDYFNSSSQPAAGSRDGDEIRSYAILTHILSPTLTFSGSAYVQKVWAEKSYLSYIEGGISGGPRISFASPLSDEMPKWTAALTLGAIYREYDGADPIIDPTAAEHDTELFVGGGLTVPLKNNMAVITEVEYRNVSSNYDTRDYDNFLVQLSLAKGF